MSVGMLQEKMDETTENQPYYSVSNYAEVDVEITGRKCFYAGRGLNGARLCLCGRKKRRVCISCKCMAM